MSFKPAGLVTVSIDNLQLPASKSLTKENIVKALIELAGSDRKLPEAKRTYLQEQDASILIGRVSSIEND